MIGKESISPTEIALIVTKNSKIYKDLDTCPSKEGADYFANGMVYILGRTVDAVCESRWNSVNVSELLDELMGGKKGQDTNGADVCLGLVSKFRECLKKDYQINPIASGNSIKSIVRTYITMRASGTDSIKEFERIRRFSGDATKKKRFE